MNKEKKLVRVQYNFKFICIYTHTVYYTGGPLLMRFCETLEKQSCK